MLEILEQGSPKGPEAGYGVYVPASGTSVLDVGEKFLKGVGNKLFVTAVSQVL